MGAGRLFFGERTVALIDLNICNLAIGRISGDPIDEMAEDSPLGAFCAENYPQKRLFLLSKYRWTFANKVALLARVEPLPGEPLPMAVKYAKPSDIVGAVHAWRETADPQRARLRPYVLDANDAYWSDQAPLFAEYTAAKPEGVWPAWFVELMVVAFAADLAGHAQNRGLQRDYEAKAWGPPGEGGEGGLYAQARNEDARMAPQRELGGGGVDAGPLVETRMGGGFGRFGFSGFSLGSQG